MLMISIYLLIASPRRPFTPYFEVGVIVDFSLEVRPKK